MTRAEKSRTRGRRDGRRYSIAEARDHLASVVHESEAGPIQLTRRGEPVAMLLSVAEYHRLTARPDAWQAVTRFRLAADPDDLPDEDVFAGVRDRSPGRDVAP